MPPAGVGAVPAAPLDAARLRSAVGLDSAGAGRPSTIWADIRVVSATGSTNTDVLEEAGAGAPEGLVIAAEEQTAGKGRLGRTWQARRGSALTFSVLLRPRSIPEAARAWFSLLAGVAVVRAVRQQSGVDARLKWPNDVVVCDCKLAGILAERSGDAIVVGIGLNVLGRSDDLPVATATSLEDANASRTDRTELLAAILKEIEQWYVRWSEAGGDAVAAGLRDEYLTLCTTLGRQVRVLLPADRVLAGRAAEVDAAGRLLVEVAPGSDTSGLPEAGPGGGGLVAVSAGDVIHVR